MSHHSCRSLRISGEPRNRRLVTDHGDTETSNGRDSPSTPEFTGVAAQHLHSPSATENRVSQSDCTHATHSAVGPRLPPSPGRLEPPPTDRAGREPDYCQNRAQHRERREASRVDDRGDAVGERTRREGRRPRCVPVEERGRSEQSPDEQSYRAYPARSEEADRRGRHGDEDDAPGRGGHPLSSSEAVTVTRASPASRVDRAVSRSGLFLPTRSRRDASRHLGMGRSHAPVRLSRLCRERASRKTFDRLSAGSS